MTVLASRRALALLPALALAAFSSAAHAGAPPTETAVSVAAPSGPGQAITVTVTVTASASPPTGTVDVDLVGPFGLDESCSGALVTAGPTSATFSCGLTPNTAGAYQVIANYPGGAAFGASQGMTSTEVPKAATTVTIDDVAPQSSVVGQALTVTASLVANPATGPAATGDIAVTSTLGGGCSIILPATSCELTPIMAGTGSLTAAYLGDDNHEQDSDSRTITVGGLATTTAVVVNPTSTVTTGAYSATATVSTGGGPTPTGTVTFADASGVRCSNVALNGSGTAQCNSFARQAGTVAMTATYAPSSSTFLASSGNANLSVTPATVVAFTTNLINGYTNPHQPIAFFVATQVNDAGGSAMRLTSAHGSVLVSDGVDSCTAALPAYSGFSSLCNLQLTTSGPRTVSVTYVPANGDTLAGAATTHDISVGPSADVSATMTSPTTEFAPNGTIAYTIVVANAGPATANSVRVRDAIPAGVTAFAWTCTENGGDCAAGTGTGAIDQVVTLPDDTSVTFTVTAQVGASPGTSIVNTVLTQSSAFGDPDLLDRTATLTHTRNDDPADLRVSVANGTTRYAAGMGLDYTVVAANDGPAAVVAAPVSVTASSELSFGTWTCTGACAAASGSGNLNQLLDLAAGQAATFIMYARVSETATGPIAVTAAISPPAGTFDPVGANNMATDEDLRFTHDLSVSLTDGSTFYRPGEQVLYAVVFANAGPDPVEAPVDIVAPQAGVSGVTWSCVASAGSACAAPSGTGDVNTLATLAAGGSVTYAFGFLVDANRTAPLSTAAMIEPGVGHADPDDDDRVANDINTRVATLLIDGFEDPPADEGN